RSSFWRSLASGAGPTAPQSVRKSTRVQAGTFQSARFTRRSTGSGPRAWSGGGSGDRRLGAVGPRPKFSSLPPAGHPALRHAYHAFTALAAGLEAQLETK